MTAWQKAKQWWDNNAATETFEETLGWHLSNGLIYSTPQVFMLARETHWDGQEANDDAGEHNAWFIELAAGAGGADIFRRLIAVAPRPQPWVLWCRRGEKRVRQFDWDKLLQKVSK